LKKQQTTVVIAATVVGLVIAYFIYDHWRPRCDAIFEQTTTRVGGNLQLIKATKGELFIGREKIQELAEGPQKVALHLKTCCVAQQVGAFSSEQFQNCMSAAKDYENKVQQVANIVREAQAAQAQGNSQLVEQKSAQAREAVSAAITRVDELRKVSETIHPVQPVKSGAEQEPNNTVLEANTATLGSTISGEINPGDDADFFRFQHQDAKNRRDIIVVHLENQSATLQPQIRVHKEDKAVALHWQRANTQGANFDLSFAALSGRSYYVAVGSVYNSIGKYTLTIGAQKAYDQYEPNDDAQTATPLILGQTVEANILDGEDVDWYRLSGANEKKTTVRFENLSKTLQPKIRVHRGDKSMLLGANTNARGADLEFSFESQPGKDYYLEVSGVYNQLLGKYKLTTH
jgi:hypothetical protein